jgi:nitronate monooxygenase
MELGASGVQVATRFTVTEECGLPYKVKQKYFLASEEDVVVNTLSPTGYLMRMLKNSPCINANSKPSCEAFGYMLSKEGRCPYIDAYKETPVDASGDKLPVAAKICLCYHFSKFQCYTCGHYVYRLKDTTRKLPDGSYQILTAEHVFNDYLYSRDDTISLPPARLPVVFEPERMTASPAL